MFDWIVAWMVDLLECAVTTACGWLVYVAFVLCCGWLLDFVDLDFVWFRCMVFVDLWLVVSVVVVVGGC